MNQSGLAERDLFYNLEVVEIIIVFVSVIIVSLRAVDHILGHVTTYKLTLTTVYAHSVVQFCY